jgi:hypothetical protein
MNKLLEEENRDHRIRGENNSQSGKSSDKII